MSILSIQPNASVFTMLRFLMENLKRELIGLEVKAKNTKEHDLMNCLRLRDPLIIVDFRGGEDSILKSRPSVWCGMAAITCNYFLFD